MTQSPQHIQSYNIISSSIILNKSIPTRFGHRIAMRQAISTILVSFERANSVLLNDGPDVEFNWIDAKLHWI